MKITAEQKRALKSKLKVLNNRWIRYLGKQHEAHKKRDVGKVYLYSEKAAVQEARLDGFIEALCVLGIDDEVVE